ncbi:MAG: flagellar basal body rod C-terminal domain-containing protein [Bryobacteraceae bacterium]|jgi:flagellar basal body rod protein FlgG
MTAIQSALEGMLKAETQLDTTASRIANLPFPTVPASQNPPQDIVDLSAEMVSLLETRNNFAANVKVAHVADDIQKSTLSILG